MNQILATLGIHFMGPKPTEFAGLLTSGEHAKQAKDIYLDWLAKRKFESQVTTGLAVLLCASEESLPAFPDVCACMRRPSILADLMVQYVYGEGKRKGCWNSAHSGPAPESFVPEEYFGKHRMAHVPPIISHNLERTEQASGFPFMRQWSFEWRTRESHLKKVSDLLG
jgi:hypothetical protein